MKFFFTFFIVCGVCVSLQLSSQTVVEMNQLTQKKGIAYYNSEPFTGKGVTYMRRKLETDPDPWIGAEYEYGNGLLQKYIAYYSDGVKHSETNKVIREYRIWYEPVAGQKQQLSEVKTADGKFTSYYKNGKVNEMGNYRNNKKDGKWTYYHENGQKRAEGNYKMGEFVGNWLYWDSAGKLAPPDPVLKARAKKQIDPEKALEILALPFYLFMK